MFDGFRLERVDVGEAVLRVRHGGSGPPLLLLHGHPRTHATWHRVAPLLARSHTVICPDLRGYGESSKPATTADHAPYAKRAMAATAWPCCGPLVTSGSPLPGTTGARTWPCGRRWTTRRR